MARRNGPRGSPCLDPRDYDYLNNLGRTEFAWEFARRNSELRRAALLCRPGAPAAVRIAGNTLVYRLRRRFGAAERFGLYHIPDPNLTARQTIAFWTPGALDSTIRLRLSRRAGPQSELFDLNRFPGTKHVLVPVAGLPELVMCGTGYTGYFALDAQPRLLPHRFFVQVQLGAFDKFAEQLNAARSLFEVVRGIGPGPWRERAFGPKRLQRALIAYDIRALHRGSHWDAARAIYGWDRAEQARRREDNSLYQRARRALSMGEKLVRGDYRLLLS